MEIMDDSFVTPLYRNITKIFNLSAHKIEILTSQNIQIGKEMGNYRYIVFALSLFISLGIIFVSIQKISKPIKALTKAAQEITKGNYTLRPIVLSRDEIGTLALSFSKMAQTVQESLNKLKEGDRLKSAFLANMSHEIRTPLNGILGFSDLLKTPNLSGEKQQKYIRVIEKSGARMLNIINDIVSISKIESGVMEVNMEESNINEQMEYIYTFFKPEAEAKGITLSLINSLPLKEAIVKTDREKLFAILTNLVKNAIKYSNRGSIELGYTKKGKQLEFYVKDRYWH